MGPHHEASVAIEAAGASPPRAPPPSAPTDVPAEAGRLLKGQGSRSASSSLNPAASPPMPLPFFSTVPPPPRHQRRGGGGGGSGGGSPAGGSPKGGGGGMATDKDGKGGSHLSLLEDEDMCPTCLEAYTGAEGGQGQGVAGTGTSAGAGGWQRREGRPGHLPSTPFPDADSLPHTPRPHPHTVLLPHHAEDNPKVLTRCGHHFHLPCLYAWLERSETCPVCSAPMHFDEII